MKLLGHLATDDRTFLEEWCREQHLARVAQSRLAPKRVEKWFGLASNLAYIHTGQAQVYVATSFEVIPSILKQMGDLLLPGWNSILVCGGDTTIRLHKDHPHFQATALSINLGVAEYEEVKPQPLGRQLSTLLPGQVLELDISIPHRATQTSESRYNVTFRTIKGSFLGPVRDYVRSTDAD